MRIRARLPKAAAAAAAAVPSGRFRRPRFSPAPPVQAKPEDEGQVQDFDAAIQRAARFGHHLSRIGLTAGRPLPGRLRGKMEPAFAADLSAVRIHEGPHVPALGALAFTRGTDIHFAPGRYDPESRTGQTLLGHELTHVLQQRAGRVAANEISAGLAINDDPTLEGEADRAGARAAQGRPAEVAGHGGDLHAKGDFAGVVQRMPRGKGNAGSKTQSREREDSIKEKRKAARGQDKGRTSSTSKSPKPRPKRDKGQKKPKNRGGHNRPGRDDSESQSPKDNFNEELEKLLTREGNQSGLLSKAKGRAHPGPESRKGHRADQVMNHAANLLLHGLEKSEPVEVQMALVGKKVLLSTNKSAATEAFFNTKKSVKNYTKELAVPDPDKKKGKSEIDRDLLDRHKKKLTAALSNQRNWQQQVHPSGEDPADIEKAQNILAAFGVQPKIFTYGGGDADENLIKSEVDKWDSTEPGLWLIKNSQEENEKITDEHAERITTKFRKKYLSQHDTQAKSAGPFGTKTPCLGCYSDTKAHIHGYDSPHVGGFFKKSSPIVSQEQLDIATKAAKDRPTTGSLTRRGRVSNTLYPPSDSDTEGSVVALRPISYDRKTGRITWTGKDGKEKTEPLSRKLTVLQEEEEKKEEMEEEPESRGRPKERRSSKKTGGSQKRSSS